MPSRRSRSVPLTDAELAAVAAPECAAPSAADLLVFAYGEGSDAAVLVPQRPCGDASNGVIRLRLRVPAGLAAALSELCPVPGLPKSGATG